MDMDTDLYIRNSTLTTFDQGRIEEHKFQFYKFQFINFSLTWF